MVVNPGAVLSCLSPFPKPFGRGASFVAIVNAPGER
jgi:hypothetical protein